MPLRVKITELAHPSKRSLGGAPSHNREEKQNRSPHQRLLEQSKKKLLGRGEHGEGLKPDPARIGHKSPMPRVIHPMLATLVDKPFDGQDWLFEVKWDGYRAITFLESG